MEFGITDAARHSRGKCHAKLTFQDQSAAQVSIRLWPLVSARVRASMSSEFVACDAVKELSSLDPVPREDGAFQYTCSCGRPIVVSVQAQCARQTLFPCSLCAKRILVKYNGWLRCSCGAAAAMF